MPTEDSLPTPPVTTAASPAASLQRKLEVLHASLSEKERRMLAAFVYCASDPIDRMLMREEQPFSDEEEALLARLDP